MAKVIIVGGGAAGIAAARVLLSTAKLDIILIEATHRFGGRARTSETMAGFDLGPQYIQDPKYNPWTKIAEEHFLEMIDEKDTFNRNVYTIRGDNVVTFNPKSEFDDGSTDFYDKQESIKEAIERQYEANKEHPNKRTYEVTLPIETVSDRYAYSQSQYGPIQEAAEVWQYIAADRSRADRETAQKRAPGKGKIGKQEIGATGNSEEADDDGGDNKFVKQGIGTMVRSVANCLCAANKDRVTVHFSERVNYIEISGSNVEVTTERSMQQYAKYDADFCILTVPVAMLQKVEFSPKLPAEIQDAFNYVKLGSYKKFAFIFDETKLAGGRHVDLDVKYELVQTRGVWQFFRLGHHPKMLVVVTYGDFAAHLDSLELEAERVCRAAFSTLLGPGALGACEMTNWTNDHYTGGAYSYTAPKQGAADNDETAFQAREKLRIRNNRFAYAGEATSLSAYGTLEGAYEEGADAANYCLKCLGLEVEPPSTAKSEIKL